MKYAVHDGPGIRTVVFLKGCPLNCWWCHNPEGQRAAPEITVLRGRCLGCGECARACRQGVIALDDVGGARAGSQEGARCVVCGDCVRACPTGARSVAGREMTVDAVMEEIRKDRVFYEQSGGGVTFSGGEPLLQPAFLDSLLKACRREEIPTAIETTGFGRTEDILKAAENTDLFLYDLKLMDDGEHRKYTGQSHALILNNLTSLAAVHPNIIVRVPIIPGINDSSENLIAIAEFVSGIDSVREIHLLPYHKTGIDKYARLNRRYSLPEVEPPDGEAMERASAIMRVSRKAIRTGGSSRP